VNSTLPFLLTLSQSYSTGWVASVNGTTLPSADHIKEENTDFNGWLINSNGTMTIDLKYKLQTTYFSSLLVSSGILIGILLYLLLATLKNVKKTRRTIRNLEFRKTSLIGKNKKL
jgi:hypothetical protein